ncbi:helix-hairpin-helix domain-containing protein [Chloroflexota bacterium]
MTTSKVIKFWMLTAILLVAIIVIGGIVVWLKCSPNQPIEISTVPVQELQGRIYIGGNVTNPGFYPFTSEDSLEALIQTAGGTTSSSNLSGIKLYIPGVGEGQELQKVDINRADVWLLEALPEIGKTLAQRIVDYRQQNGLFHNTNELTKVAGIGTIKYEKIKDLVTVAD